VKNNVEFKMEPEWYFTSRELEQYMEIVTRKKWVTGEVGMKLEAFAIAGCDPASTSSIFYARTTTLTFPVMQICYERRSRKQIG
jgi:hypothetical protein